MRGTGQNGKNLRRMRSTLCTAALSTILAPSKGPTWDLAPSKGPTWNSKINITVEAHGSLTKIQYVEGLHLLRVTVINLKARDKSERLQCQLH